MATLGLLPQAAKLVEEEFNAPPQRAERPAQTKARIQVVKTELDLLKHELALAQQRGQLHKRYAEARVNPGSSAPTSIDELKQKSVSQLGQDLWVLEQTGYKRGGFFVEFGATDGVLLSNTWLLESEFGWQGICAEPNPTFFEQLKANRKCTVSKACIAGQTGKEVDFIFADAYGGLAQYAGDDMHAASRKAYAETGFIGKVTTISLHDFLVEHGAPRDIDYLSIDTEGSELEILAAFPFSDWNIRLLTVEHNFTPQRAEIRTLLVRYGYRCVEREWDDWYIASDQVMVRPDREDAGS
jgi:FkbM family methyltransferase